jgi:hypothetical protein
MTMNPENRVSPLIPLAQDKFLNRDGVSCIISSNHFSLAFEKGGIRGLYG